MNGKLTGAIVIIFSEEAIDLFISELSVEEVPNALLKLGLVDVDIAIARE